MGDIVLNILEEPSIPFSPDNPMNTGSVMKKVFVAALAAFAALFGVLSFMKDTLKTEEDIQEKLDARSMGAISYEIKYKSIRELLRRKKKGLLINDPLAGFGFVESFRKFSARVEYRMEREGWKTLAVTSVSENEGKSTVAANLAISLAEKDYRVVLIDGDLKRPSQFLIFGLHPKEENELGEFLKREKKEFNLFMKTSVPRLYVVSGRNCYSSSTDILQNEVTAKFMRRCREAADFVIVDTPPTAVLGDAELWGQCTDAVLFVERQNFIYAEDINTMIDKFRAQDTRILGVVMNGVQSFGRVVSSTVGRYSSRYGEYGNYGKKHKESEQMSENVEATEKKTSPEIEKIDIMNLVAAFWNGFKRLWFVLVIIVIVCTVRSYFSTSFSYTPQYVASATVSVTTPGGSYTNIESAHEMAAIFPYILTSGVLEDVVLNDMGLKSLPGQIEVEAEEGMNMLTISVSSDDPQMAYNVLQSVIKNYPEVAEYIFGETNLQILDETGIPSDTQREVVIRGSYKRALCRE